MAKRTSSSTESGGEDKSGDIRVALKMPARGSLENRQVAKAFKSVRAALRSSSGGSKRRGVSSRTRGAGAGATTKSGLGKSSSRSSAGSKPLQRVAVRWTYSKNKGDGQWGAHGKYVERESAQEHELEQEIKQLDHELEPEMPLTPDQEQVKNNRADQEINNESRYDNALSVRDPRRADSLCESYLREIGKAPEAKSLNGVRSLSGVGVVRWQRGGEMLLPSDAPHHVVERGTERDDSLRRGSDGKPGKRAGDAGRVKRALGFGSAGDAVPISETLDRWQKTNDEHMFKLIVSPEFGDKMDLKRHTKELIAQMEKDLGSKLEWVAIAHFNTDNPHVHLSIRGVDDKGQALSISPAYIKQGSRTRAQEAATRQLGYRSEKDVAEGLDRQVSQQRFTDIDRSLVKKAVNEKVSFEGIPPASEKAREMRLRQIRRLAQLEAMGLATKTQNMVWQLKPSLETALRQMQVSQDRLKSKFQHKEMITDPSAPLVATDLKKIGDRVSGRVVGTGLDEKTNRPYVMLEGVDGKVHYVNQNYKMQKMRGDGEIKTGDYISLEVLARKDKAGKSVGEMVKVENYGKKISPELIDKELARSGKVVEPITRKKTVAGEYLEAAAQRIKKLEKAGAIEIDSGRIKEKSPLAYDKVRYEDSGMRVSEYSKGSFVAKVMAKGSQSFALRSSDGKEILLHHSQIESMGVDKKYVSKDATIFVGVDSKGKAIASVLKKEQLSNLVQDLRTNKLDLISQQVKNILPSDPLHSAIKQRQEVWKSRGVDLDSQDFNKAAGVWRKNMELAESQDLANVVNSRQLNRLDWMLQQSYQATSSPLENALRERAEVWKGRGVDPAGDKFTLKANSWRKSVELHEDAQNKGVDTVLGQLAKERGKPVRELDCAPGRQISGRVLLVQKGDTHTSVVIDSGRELTHIRQPLPSETELKAGQRVRAKAEEIADKNTQRRMMMWRFADLEREQAKQKNQERKLF